MRFDPIPMVDLILIVDPIPMVDLIPMVDPIPMADRIISPLIPLSNSH